MGARGLLASLLIAATASGAAVGAPALGDAGAAPVPDKAGAVAVRIIPSPAAPGIRPDVIGGGGAPPSAWPYLAAVVSPIGLCTCLLYTSPSPRD